ncbi:MAG: RNA 2',3'-cyclic phosphodiesterase [Thermodesulfovibrio sp.]|nr:RNA 2',3'-cyclic phosphodiesterase [Thermodesulfovibrio sp.]
MRCFIAIELPQDIKESISSLIDKLRHISKGIRWVPVENIHLTIKFLGEVKDDLIPEIEKRLSSIRMNHGSFSVAVRRTGAFPNFKYPNILWMGIDESEDLSRLYSDIDKTMSELGFEKENRKFSPHLTIGRVKDTKGIEPVFKEIYTLQDNLFGSIEAKEILLMKSVLKPTGAEYSKIAGFKLGER